MAKILYINERLKEAGITGHELARRMNISYVRANAITKSQTLRVDTLAAVANATNIDIRDFFRP